MKAFLTICLYSSLSILLLLGCSKSENPINMNDDLNQITISSTAHNDITGLDLDVLFNVKDENGTDYTFEADIFIDGTLLESNTYTFTQIGVYKVVAQLNDLTSNTLQITVIDQNSRVLDFNENRLMRNQNVVFTLMDYTGEDTANQATFYINDNPITGYTFNSETPGEYKVYASYEVDGQTRNTETKEFSVYIPKRYLVIEDYTGTWCGYCPGVLEAIDKVTQETEYVNVVALHKTSFSFEDPMHFDDLPILENEYDVQGYPSARINRSQKWNRPYPHEEAMTYAGSETDCSIKIDSKFQKDKLKLEVDIIFEKGTEAGDKIVVYLVENGIISDQINYYNDDPDSPYYQAGNPIPDFEHNNVLRESLTHVLGDELPSLDAFQKHSLNFEINLNPEYEKENLEVIVMLVDLTHTAKNSRSVKIGDKAEYN